VPQAAVVFPVLQVPLSQQPAQFVGPQTLTQEPLWHVVPVGQATQVTPPVPQNWFEVPALQVLPSQQPLGQLAGVQTQVPLWHSRFAAPQFTHGVPPVPQCWVLLVWQVLFWQQPFGQLAGVQTQTPLTHSWSAAH
jgi:hypothetical protein